MKLTTLCYLEKDEQYLLLFRNKKENDENRGKWVGVGGKFEEGESPDDCLQREVTEETGLILDCYRPRGIVTFVSDCYGTEYMHLYTSDRFHGCLHQSEEGTLRYVDKKKLAELPMWEGDAIFLSLIANNAPFFSLKLVYKADTLTNAYLNGEELQQPWNRF